MVQVVCINCQLQYPTGYCLLELPNGCKPEDKEAVEVFDDESLDSYAPVSENKDANLNDPISTGRKRAAKLYPISPGQVCDWAWRKQCGGGIVPIFGCTGRPATDIHHGPDKSTLNNDRDTNISIVCSHCHNRWHTANDKYYVEPRPKDNLRWVPSKGIEALPIYTLADIEKATKQEILMNEMLIPAGGKDKL